MPAHSAMPPQSAAPPPPRATPPPPRVPLKRKSKSVWRTVFIVLGVLAIPVAGCGVWLFSQAKPTFDAANEFLAVVDQGDYATAADMTRCGLTASDLNTVFNGQDIDYNLKEASISNGSRAVVSGTIDIPQTSFSQISLRLLKSGDEWYVCAYFIT